jgi:hypothetical protein
VRLLRTRVISAFLGLLFAMTAGPAVALGAGGLTQGDKKAVDIIGVDAETTGSDTYVEITFKGKLARELGTGALKGARVTTALVPQTGPATVITDRGTSHRPKEGRAGTAGRFATVRNDRTIRMLVEDLPAPTATIEVTTSEGALPAAARRGGAGVLDFLQGVLQPPIADDSVGASIKRAEEERDAEQRAIDATEDQIDKVGDKIAKARRDQETAETKAERDEATNRRKRHEARREALRQELKRLKEELALTNRWISKLKGFSIPEPAQCADSRDNDGDSLADHPADPGCLDALDNDEKDVPLPLACPAPGNSVSPFAIINTPQTNEITALRLSKAASGALVLEAPVTSPSIGPTPLGGDICGPGIDVTYQYVVYTDGTPFSLPDPPPGDFSICIFIEADNPPASSNPGGQDASMRFSIATAIK